MNKIIAAVVSQSTKHVLAAVTRVDNPDGELAAEQLVGDGLPIYDPKTADPRGTIGKEELEVVIAEGDEGVLVAPLSRMVKDGVYHLLKPPPTVIFNNQTISVTLDTEATEETLFYALLSTEEDTISFTGKIAGGTKTAEREVPELGIGNRNTIVLVAGHIPFIALEPLPLPGP